MTMPHLENCPHNPGGWCLDCVKELGDQVTDLRLAIFETTLITFEAIHDEGLESIPSSVRVKSGEEEQFIKAHKITSAACKKWLI